MIRSDYYSRQPPKVLPSRGLYINENNNGIKAILHKGLYKTIVYNLFQLIYCCTSYLLTQYDISVCSHNLRILQVESCFLNFLFVEVCIYLRPILIVVYIIATKQVLKKYNYIIKVLYIEIQYLYINIGNKITKELISRRIKVQIQKSTYKRNRVYRKRLPLSGLLGNRFPNHWV